MERKKDLAKIALAAFILSSTLPVDGQASSGEIPESFLAAKCGAHGCPGNTPPANKTPSKGEIADNTRSDSDFYNTRSNTYQIGSSSNSQPYHTGSHSPASNYRSSGRYDSEGAEYPGTVGYPEAYSGSSYRNGSKDIPSSYNGYTGSYRNDGGSAAHTADDSYYYNSYNANRVGPTNPSYVDRYHRTSVETDTFAPTNLDYGTTHLNREYNTVNDYDFNRSSVTTVTSSATLTEAQLLALLSPQGRAIYLSLDPEAKSLAIQLASQDSYRDKNLAVKEAQRRMNERRGIMSR